MAGIKSAELQSSPFKKGEGGKKRVSLQGLTENRPSTWKHRKQEKGQEFSECQCFHGKMTPVNR